ncbi:MAG: sulfatase/phosphatase domain-containing protein, partial [Planctomycetota bacterium]
ILDALEAQGVRDGTMVVFLSDNGGPEPRPDRAGGKGNGSDNKPLRAGKGSMYEGGSRVPFLVSWPARLPAGVQYDRPVIAIDIARTAVELAGADAGDELEGRNIVPFLTREREGDPHDVLFWRGHNGSRFALRSGDLKLVKPSWESDKVELFDLSADLGEETDLASSRPDELQRLLDLWHAWNADNQRNDMLGTLPYHKLRGELYDSELMAE